MINTPQDRHPAILILSEQARDYARQISQCPDPGIPFTACTRPEEAIRSFRGETIVLGEPHLVAEAIDQLPGVCWVQSTWAGVKPLIDLGPRSWQLTGVKEVFGSQMSEYVVGYLLAHELKLLERAEQQQRRNWFSEESGSLRGKRAGVLGTGSIGSHIARVLRRLGVHVDGLNKSGHRAEPFDRVFTSSEFIEFLSGLDYLVAILPETASTSKLIDADALDALPDHAVLVNVGRGNILDEAALVEALENGKLGAAVLDVFNTEPLPADSPLWSAPRLLISGHVAARSRTEDITPLFLDNYRRYVSGQALAFLIDFKRGY